MRRIVFLIIFTLLLDLCKGQSQLVSIGLGGSLTQPFQRTIGIGLGFAITPILNIKYLKHELLLGPDLYIMGSLHNDIFKAEPYDVIVGSQVEYRRHLTGNNEKYNFFINTNFQYVQYQKSCLFARPYNFTPRYYDCIDYRGELLKQKSLINTYGLGFEYNFLKCIYVYSVFGLGYNYTILNELDGKKYFGGNRINLVGTFRFGLSISIFKSSK